MGALPAAYEGREHQYLRSLRKLQDAVYYLLRGLALYHFTALWTVRYAYACEEKPEIIVNFGLGAYSGSRIGACGPLLYGYGGRQAFYMIDIRFL